MLLLSYTLGRPTLKGLDRLVSKVTADSLGNRVFVHAGNGLFTGNNVVHFPQAAQQFIEQFIFHNTDPHHLLCANGVHLLD